MNEEELKFEEKYGQHTKPKEFTDFKCPDCGYCFSDTLNKFYHKDKIKCTCGAYRDWEYDERKSLYQPTIRRIVIIKNTNNQLSLNL